METQQVPGTKEEEKEDDIYVVIVSSSRSFYNYRHTANALLVYNLVKNLGVSDNRIILMLAEGITCNPRNVFCGEIYSDINHQENLYGYDVEDWYGYRRQSSLTGASTGGRKTEGLEEGDFIATGNGNSLKNRKIEIDYQGEEVTVTNLIKVLTGKHDPETPLHRTLPHPTSRSKVLLYMTGHGGDQFLKFHNHEELTSDDLKSIVVDMHNSGRLGELFYIIDTCQAGTMLEGFRNLDLQETNDSNQNNLNNNSKFKNNNNNNENNNNNLLMKTEMERKTKMKNKALLFSGIGSSGKDENSYAHENDRLLGVALTDRFTDFTISFLKYVADFNIASSFSDVDSSYNPSSTGRSFHATSNSGKNYPRHDLTFHQYKKKFKQIYYGSRGGQKRTAASTKFQKIGSINNRGIRKNISNPKILLPSPNSSFSFNERKAMLQIKNNLDRVSVEDLLASYYPEQLKSNPVYFSTKPNSNPPFRPNQKSGSISMYESSKFGLKLGDFFSYVSKYSYTHNIADRERALTQTSNDNLDSTSTTSMLETRFETDTNSESESEIESEIQIKGESKSKTDMIKKPREMSKSKPPERQNHFSTNFENFITMSSVTESLKTPRLITKVINYDCQTFRELSQLKHNQSSRQMVNPFLNITFVFICLLFVLDFVKDTLFYRRRLSKEEKEKR